jgi:integrase
MRDLSESGLQNPKPKSKPYRKNLSDLLLQNPKLKSKPYEIIDTKSATRLVVFPSGAQSFICRFRFNGMQRKLTLGVYPGLSLADARIAAADAMKLLHQGKDPAEAKRQAAAGAAAAAADTVETVCTEYLARVGNKLRAVTLAAQHAYFTKHVYPVIGSKPISAVRRSDIVRLLDGVEENAGPFAADTGRAYLNTVFVWFEGRSDDFRSPLTKAVARRVAKADRERDRVLTNEEIQKIWLAAEKSKSQFGVIVRLLLLTAARRNEISEMEWLEFQEGLWVLPAVRSKTKVEVPRPLGAAAQALVDAQPRFDGCPFVFTANGRTPFRGMSFAKREFDEACGVKDWRLHDLRRTARTLMSRAGVVSDHAERCLGHALQGSRGVYDRHQYADEMRHAFAALASLIERIVRPIDNVIDLRATSPSAG